MAEKINPKRALTELRTKSSTHKPNQVAVRKEFIPVSFTEKKSEFKQQVRQLDIRQFHIQKIEKEINVSTMARINKESPQQLRNEMALLILDLHSFYSVKNGMNKDMIEDVVEMILSEYSNLTLYDLALCFREVKIGRYGKIYDRIDGGLVMEWLRKYYGGFIDAVEEAHQQRKNQYSFGERQSGYKKIWKRRN